MRAPQPNGNTGQFSRRYSSGDAADHPVLILKNSSNQHKWVFVDRLSYQLNLGKFRLALAIHYVAADTCNNLNGVALWQNSWQPAATAGRKQHLRRSRVWHSRRSAAYFEGR